MLELNEKLHVIFVLDETGSMKSVQDKTISGFNEYVDGLRNKHAKGTRFSLVQFNTEKYAIVHDRAKLKAVSHLNAETYQPDNGTPLYDAIGKTLARTEAEYANGNRMKTLVTILTDGMENSSKEYTFAKIRDYIKELEAKDWTFVFLGANFDSYEVGTSISMDVSNIANYNPAQPQVALDVMFHATADWLDSRGTKRRGLVDQKRSYKITSSTSQ